MGKPFMESTHDFDRGDIIFILPLACGMRNKIEMDLSMSFLKPNKCAQSLHQWIVIIPFLKPTLTKK